MNSWAIKDDEKILVKGRYDDIMHIWNVNTATDEAYERWYGHRNRDQSLIIKEYFGGLQLIQVVYDLPCEQRRHLNSFYKED
jgi:hypothetical protein